MKNSNKLLPGQKYALTLKEATEYYSVGEKAMTTLARNKELHLAIYSGNRWLFIRERVEEYFTHFLYEENQNFKLNIYPDEE